MKKMTGLVVVCTLLGGDEHTAVSIRLTSYLVCRRGRYGGGQGQLSMMGGTVQ